MRGSRICSRHPDAIMHWLKKMSQWQVIDDVKNQSFSDSADTTFIFKASVPEALNPHYEVQKKNYISASWISPELRNANVYDSASELYTIFT